MELNRMATTPQPQVFPLKLAVEEGNRLVIEWNDGVRHSYTWATLRTNCPCAGCRTEREKPPALFPIIKPEETQPARPKSIEPVGRYAYQITWNDGHDSGIYSFEFLRQLGAESAPVTSPSGSASPGT